MFAEKQSRTPPSGVEPLLDALEYLLQVWLHDPVEDFAPVLFARQEAAPLHQSQMFRGHGARQVTGLGQFADSVVASHQHLNHPQPVWVRQRAKTFRRLSQGLQVRQLLFHSDHDSPPHTLKYIGMFRLVNEYSLAKLTTRGHRVLRAFEL